MIGKSFSFSPVSWDNFFRWQPVSMWIRQCIWEKYRLRGRHVICLLCIVFTIRAFCHFHFPSMDGVYLKGLAIHFPWNMTPEHIEHNREQTERFLAAVGSALKHVNENTEESKLNTEEDKWEDRTEDGQYSDFVLCNRETGYGCNTFYFSTGNSLNFIVSVLKLLYLIKYPVLFLFLFLFLLQMDATPCNLLQNESGVGNLSI